MVGGGVLEDLLASWRSFAPPAHTAHQAYTDGAFCLFDVWNFAGGNSDLNIQSQYKEKIKAMLINDFT